MDEIRLFFIKLIENQWLWFCCGYVFGSVFTQYYVEKDITYAFRKALEHLNDENY